MTVTSETGEQSDSSATILDRCDCRGNIPRLHNERNEQEIMVTEQLPGMPDTPPVPLPPPTEWWVLVQYPDDVWETKTVGRPLFDHTGNWVILELEGGGWAFVSRSEQQVVSAVPYEGQDYS